MSWQKLHDTGKPWQEAECVDVVTGADAIEYFASLAPTVVGQQQEVAGDFYYTRKEALGGVPVSAHGTTPYK